MKRSQEKSVSHTINLESAKIISQNTLKLPHIDEELLYQKQPLHQNYYRTPVMLFQYGLSHLTNSHLHQDERGNQLNFYLSH